MTATRLSQRAFAERYRRERNTHGDRLPYLILAAVLGLRAPVRLRSWLAPFTPPELSSALETVLEKRQPGVHSTSADVARYMASSTILPSLLAGLALPRGKIAKLIADNRDLETFARDWLASANRRELSAYQRRLDQLTVLDPACGTGPFLLAALRVLEQQYTVCLDRLGLSSCRAAIRQRIVTHNLHGIDLDPEAVELCRLRFRLELLAEMPAIDNLNVGNALTSPVSVAHAVVLGNPPYLEFREADYAPQGFRCQETGAIHALFIERGLEYLRPDGWISMIMPLSLVSTQRMKCVQELLEADRNVWYANFSWRPARLFPGVNRAMTLFIASTTESPRTWTTGYLKWRSRDRVGLMRSFSYTEAPRDRSSFWVPKLGDERERPLLEKLLRVPTCLADFLGNEDAPERRIYYRTDGGLYWKVFTDFAPTFSCNGRAGHSTRQTWLTVREPAFVAPLIAVLSSDLFWWWYTVTSNCRHVNPIDLHRVPLPASVLDLKQAKGSAPGKVY